jgi:hypothetical protein
MRAVEYDVGRAFLSIDTKQAEFHLRNFHAGMPEDTYGYCESFADLSEALLGQMRGQGGGDNRSRRMTLLLSQLQHLVSEGQRTMDLRLPVLRRLEAADFPKTQELKNHANMLEMAVKKGVRKEGDGKRPESSRSARNGADDDSGTEHAAGGQKCFACGVTLMVKKVCAGCKVAQYCSKECQASHWKSHKAQCKKLTGG